MTMAIDDNVDLTRGNPRERVSYALHYPSCLPQWLDGCDETDLEKAEDEEIPVLSSPLSAYDICGRMAAAGLKGPMD